MKYPRRTCIDRAYPKDDPNAELQLPSRDGFYSTPTRGKDSFTCPLCRTERKAWFFPVVPSTTLGFVEEPKEAAKASRKGLKHSIFCMPCIIEMGKKLDEEYDGDAMMVLYRICSFLDVPFDVDTARKVLADDDRIMLPETASFYEEPMDPRVTYVDAYLRYVNGDDALKRRSFWTEAKPGYDALVKYQSGESVVDSFDEKDRKTRRALLAIFHYDPFEQEDAADRPRMMEDLLTMTDDSMADDLVRQKAAIEIVKAFARIDKIGTAINVLQATPKLAAENAKQISDLIAQKKKETDMVTAFSKDHGFAEKYANAKSKGSGTLSAIVRDITEYGYDQGAINKFDIDTSEAIKQVSDISAESIFKQISFSDSDYADMVRQQATKIQKMQDLLASQSEELRLLKEKHLKAELLDEYKADLKNKGIKEAEIAGLVQEALERPVEFRKGENSN